MRHVSCIVAVAALAGALAGCADPYYPRNGYSQAYYSPNYSYYPPPNYSYSQPRYSYDTRSDYYRNYNGIHAGPERTFP